jgi:tetratricopeptide (TPR) repeat protein
LRYLEKVLKLQPDNGDAIYYEGYIALLDGHLQDALDHLQEAIRRTPDDVKAHYALALTYSRMRRPRESDEELKKFHELQAAHEEQNKGAVYLSPHAQPRHDTYGRP